MGDQKGRIEYIDFARGVAMLLCMVGHAGITGILRGYIYSFHMPLFFIISGMVYKNKSITSEFVKKKSKELLLPYFFWSCVWLVFWATLYFLASKFGIENEKIFSLSDSIIGIVLDTRGSRFGGYLWFLYALFLTSIIFDLLNRIRDWRKILAITIALVWAEIIYLFIGAPAVPFCIDVVPITLIFMYVGKAVRGGG